MMITRATYLLMLLLLTGGLPSAAQEHCLVELATNMRDFQLIPSGDLLSRVKAPSDDYFYPEDSHLPMLPLKTVTVLVPNGAVLTEYSFSYDEMLFMGGVKLRCAATPIPTSGSQPARKDAIAYQGSFPENALSYNSTLVQRGYTWFSFTYSPFSYHSDSRELNLITNLKLDVEYSLSDSETSVIRPERSVSERLKSLPVNAEDFERFYPVDVLAEQKSAAERVDYLLLTTEALKAGFEPLVEWKVRKGLNAEIITMEEIDAAYDEPDIQLKIKACLRDYYIDHGLTWVLLGGDDDVVPVQACYGYVRNEVSEIIDESVPTDLFYACFDRKFNWNAIDDSLIGQVHRDDVDLVPEVFLSRAAVKTREDVDVFVRKTLNYEKNPPPSGFTEKILLSGIVAWSQWEGKSDSHHRSELLFDNYISGQWDGAKMGFYDTGTDFSEGADYHVTADNLSEQLNEGYGIFMFTGHGNNKYLVMEHGNRFTSAEAMELTNPFSGLVMSNACNVNAFDSIDPCLSEAFLRNPEGGGIAFFGSSRFGFGIPEPDLSLGPSLQYNAKFLKYLLNPGAHGNSLASVASMAKEDFIYTGALGGTYLYLQYAINTLGDPELPLYTTQPSEFSRLRMYRIGTDLTVNTGGMEACRICLTSLDFDEGYKQVIEGSSFYTFEDVPESFQITITAPNYKPYIYKSSRTTGMVDLMSAIRIYPNPTAGMMQIELDHSGYLQVFDLRGSLFVEQDLFPGSNGLDLSEFPDGAYMLNFILKDGNGWYKVLKLER